MNFLSFESEEFLEEEKLRFDRNQNSISDDEANFINSVDKLRVHHNFPHHSSGLATKPSLLIQKIKDKVRKKTSTVLPFTTAATSATTTAAAAFVGITTRPSEETSSC
jgi:hypothetical protein